MRGNGSRRTDIIGDQRYGHAAFDQACSAIQLARWQSSRDQNVAEPVVGEILRLGQRRDRNPSGLAVDRHSCNDRRLCSLEMRPQRGAVLSNGTAHPLEIPLEDSPVEYETGSLKILEPHDVI